MAVDKNLRLGATASSANDLGNMGALTPILGQLAGGSKRGQMAADFARQLYQKLPRQILMRLHCSSLLLWAKGHHSPVQLY